MQNLDLSVSVQQRYRSEVLCGTNRFCILSQPGPVLWVAHAKAGATRPGTAPRTGARELRGMGGGRGPANMQCIPTASMTSFGAWGPAVAAQCRRRAGWRWNYRDWSGTCMPYAQPCAAMQVCCAVP